VEAEKVLVCGDIHGKVTKYRNILDATPNIDMSIQLGDFGFKKENLWFIDNIYNKENKHRILFGNHDYYPFINMPYSLINRDNMMNPILISKSIFCVRGASSIDTSHRTEGVDWFRDEELSYIESRAILEDYELMKPDIIIAHDCPSKIRRDIFSIRDKTITSELLQQMIEIHTPSLFIHGHHHTSYIYIDEGCEYKGLEELEKIII
jgi:Icc-related predicted phosphoesterase